MRVLESHPEHAFFFFFSSSIAVFFIAKPSSILVFVGQTKWTFNHEGRGHRSLIGVSRGIGRHTETLWDFLNIKYRTHDAEINLCDIKLFVIYHIEQNGIQTQANRRLGCRQMIPGFTRRQKSDTMSFTMSISKKNSIFVVKRLEIPNIQPRFAVSPFLRSNHFLL